LVEGGADGIEDDQSIADDCRMLRRIPPYWLKDFRPESSNFENREPDPKFGLSVTIWESEADLEAVIAEEPSFGVVCVTAGQLRAEGCAIVRRPLDQNPNHCECFGNPGHGARRRLAKSARWVHVPAGHDPDPYGPLESLG
jgi:hypothetical protein